MGEFSEREIEIYDRIATLIGSDMVTIEFNIKDKSKLEYLLCSNFEEKQKVTQKKVKRFKKEIDNCREEIAGYLLALADIFDNGHYYLEQDDVTKNFISDYYDDLVQILVQEDKDISEVLDLEYFITSYGYSYELIQDYINGVCNMYFYQYYKSLLDLKGEEQQEPIKPTKETILINEDLMEASIYNEILLIINNPIKELMKEDLYFKSIDENGVEIYIENTDPENLNVDREIIDPFGKLESLTSKLMETTKHSIVLEGYLKKIFKEFIETFAILIDIDDNDIGIENKDKYPENFTFFCYMYKYKLSKYYDFIIEFLDDKFLEVENKVIVDDLRYLLKENKSVENNLSINGKDTVPNNLLKSTIEDYLEEFKEEINNNGYEILVDALFEYFSNDTFPILSAKINFKSINKKRVGLALKKLHKSEKLGKIPFEYLVFAKENINLFANETLEEATFTKSNLYKAFTTNPAK